MRVTASFLNTRSFTLLSCPGSGDSRHHLQIHVCQDHFVLMTLSYTCPMVQNTSISDLSFSCGYVFVGIFANRLDSLFCVDISFAQERTLIFLKEQDETRTMLLIAL
jgi:hypothetical protein